MVRICFVNSLRSWGGAEVWMLESALGLMARGISVAIVAQPGSALYDRAVQAGVTAAAIAVRFDGAPWTIARLCSCFSRWRPQAVIANLTKDLKAAALAGRLVGVPCRLATRESDFPLKDKAYYRWYFNHLATGVIVNSKATRRTVLDSAPWLDAAKVHLLYKGVDLVRFAERERAPGTSTVGFVGQLIERKGIYELMAAWDRLESAEPHTPRRLLIAGEGPLRGAIESWQRRLRCPASVELLGHCEDLVPIFHKLDVLVAPSRSEGFGLAIAEAGACGVPVVATNTSSIPEIVTDGTTGRLVTPGDIDALATAIAEVLEDGDLAARLGRAARLRVARHFDREITLDRMLALTAAPACYHG